MPTASSTSNMTGLFHRRTRSLDTASHQTIHPARAPCRWPPARRDPGTHLESWELADLSRMTGPSGFRCDDSAGLQYVAPVSRRRQRDDNFIVYDIDPKLSRLGHRVLTPLKGLTVQARFHYSKVGFRRRDLDLPSGPVRAAHHPASPILSRRLVMETSSAVYGLMHHHFKAVLLDLRH